MRNLLVGVAALMLLGVVPASGTLVSVAYAGSLVATMEGPLKSAFEQASGITFQGEGKGSKALANLMRDGDLNPDVFLSADAALYPGLRTFGHADLVVGYAPSSRFAGRLDAAAAGKVSLTRILATPGLRLARTDPQLDPKGEKTLTALAALGLQAGGPAQMFPEEELLTRVQTGEADCGFFYSTEVGGAGLRWAALPDGIGSRKGIAVDYAIVALATAPHPAAAKAFVDFVLRGGGRAILQRAGIGYDR
ncbi:MAG TPA: extracellular solute-binding protein [Verrucomicrobiae bacterium]|nr:extracellular solute-binding protein [Verrucomicrobiae bacterium]